MRNYKLVFKNQSGQTIIEAVVALMTIMLIMTAIAIVIVNGLYNSQYIKNQNEANKYAQEGMEFVRSIQQNDLKSFKDYSESTPTTYCIDTTNNVLSRTSCNISGNNIASTQFNRLVDFSAGDARCENFDGSTASIKVTVTVKWSSSKCGSNAYCHKSELISCMPYILPATSP